MSSLSVSPFLPTPLSDFMFFLSPMYRQNLNDPLCVKLESKFMDCLDAYGSVRAREKCADLIYDLSECSLFYAQEDRVNRIRKERMRQYRQGKLSRPFEEHPPLDSLMGLPR